MIPIIMRTHETTSETIEIHEINREEAINEINVSSLLSNSI